ncbi:hypothetical protein GP486_002925 [Trichoglossum hirsutum]|uniref:Uncharacterized protein n=1 Tax=Trichoglossum hirsutum TaxID=265104 RepID=A0A9P8RR79_9PEZI|nr:hypothetical protein GP486_002925 [Trichoglossum hirsutum]
MSGFPNLQPAFTLQEHIGNVSRGATVQVITFKGGSLKSEPGFSPAVDAKVAFGADFLRIDPSQKHVRLDVRSFLKNHNGSVGTEFSLQPLISFGYTGYIETTEAITKIFEGSPEAATVEFGNIFCHFTFETGDDSLKGLERGEFVGAGRFIVEHGKPLTVEYKISKLIKGS